MNERPDLDAMRRELQDRKRDSVLAGLAVLGMLVLNLLVLGGALFIILMAPIAWLYWSVVRVRALSRALARAAGG